MKIVVFISVMLLVTSCIFFPPENGVVIKSSGEILYTDILLPVYEEDFSAPLGSHISRAAGRVISEFPYTIQQVAQIPAVTIENKAVQANDIIISGNKAFAAYNTAGEESRGAIQIINIANPSRPDILFEILFPSHDINVLHISGDTLYFGGQSNPDITGYRSFAGKLSAARPDADAIVASLRGLDSYAVTGITDSGGNLYVSTGALSGSIHQLDSNLSILNTYSLSDVRDIESFNNGFIAVTGTTDSAAVSGAIHSFENADFPAESAHTSSAFSDFGSAYHKASIETYLGHYAFLALAEDGLKAFDLLDTTLTSTDPAATQLIEVYTQANPAVADILPYTNSVSYTGNLIFTANGEYGFRIHTVIDSSNLSGTGNDSESGFAVLTGFYPFDDLHNLAGQLYSANHIEYKGSSLFVAAGVGGVLICTIKDK